MCLWITFFLSIGVAFIAIKIGFFEIFTLFINALISIYVALFTTPLLIYHIPQAGDMPLGFMMAYLVVSIGLFVLLYSISYFLITGQYTVPFPKAFDVVFAGSLGFILGFLVLSFLFVLVAHNPVPMVSNLVPEHTITPNANYLGWWCDHLHAWVDKTPKMEQPTAKAIAFMQELNAPPPVPDPNDQRQEEL